MNGTTEHKESTYSIPSNATHVKFKVKPISTKHKVNNKDTAWWTAGWSDLKVYTNTKVPTTPSSPSVTIDEFKLTAELNNIEDDADTIEFQIVKDNSSIFKTGKVKINYASVSYSCNINPGGKYKVRCRAIKGSNYSEWSGYSNDQETIPTTPTGIRTIRANSKTEIYLEWDAVPNAKKYDIEYTTKKEYFNVSSQTQTQTDVEGTTYILTGLETGNTYFVRIRSKNDQGESSWSSISYVTIGTVPDPPTTWSSCTTATTDPNEELYLYWTHNSEDGSSEYYAQLELDIDGNKQTIDIKNKLIDDPDHKDDVKFYKIDTSKYREGATIKWRVRTSGITLEYGEWSIIRTIDIYAPPVLELNMLDVNKNEISVLESFPFYIKGIPGPNTQSPIGYYVSIVSNSTYETTDRIGNDIIINEGDEVFSKYYDINNDILMIEVTPDLVDLENNIEYKLIVTASMNSGLTVSSEIIFTISWSDITYMPSAEIGIDKESVSAYIRPYCMQKSIVNKLLKLVNGNEYEKTNTLVNGITNEILMEDGYYIEDNEPVYLVYQGTNSSGEIVKYYQDDSAEEIVENVKLAVYRREFDGSYTEIGSNLDNTKNTFVVDPHPSLDYARYRIVATETTTGSISFTDIPSYPVEEKSIIIQWDEKWSQFNVDANSEELENPPWTGSLLRLPYNIDVSDSHSSDVSLVNYIGRKHPVSYYGTHLGETSSWKTEIPIDDKDTLYALRRLAIWMGNCYVREPSGSGYWAHVSVSFSQTHCQMTIPVTLNITRVEGGI